MRPIVKIASWFALLTPFVLLSIDVTTAADDLEKQRQALNIIVDYAGRICVTVPPKGRSDNVELSGKAKAELNELLKKIANLGIEGAAQYQASQYEGVLQKELAEQLNKSRDCQREVSQDLIKRLLPPLSEATPPPERPPDGNVLTELRDDQSDWITKGNNYNLVDGQLSSQGLFTAYVKNAKWDNYAVEFDMKELSPFSSESLDILIRRQSDTDYVAMRWFRPAYNFCKSRWVIARRGQETLIVNSEKIHDCVGHYQIEVDGNRYKALRD